MQLETHLTTCVHSCKSVCWDLWKSEGGFSFNLTDKIFEEWWAITLSENWSKIEKVYKVGQVSSELQSE